MRLKSRLVFVCAAAFALAASAESPQEQLPDAGSSASGVSTPGPAVPGPSVPAPAASIPIALDWTPPQLALLGQAAEVKNSFVLNRNMLDAVSGLLPDSDADTRQSIRKLDGVAVHLYRFHAPEQIDPLQLDQLRQAYHARGWKHLLVAGKDAPVHSGTTDLWLAVDGVNVRGGAVLVVTPKTVSLVNFAGNLNPVDLLHLRGHFGIPNFTGDKFENAH